MKLRPDHLVESLTFHQLRYPEEGTALMSEWVSVYLCYWFRLTNKAHITAFEREGVPQGDYEVPRSLSRTQATKPVSTSIAAAFPDRRSPRYRGNRRSKASYSSPAFTGRTEAMYDTRDYERLKVKDECKLSIGGNALLQCKIFDSTWIEDCNAIG